MDQFVRIALSGWLTGSLACVEPLTPQDVTALPERIEPVSAADLADTPMGLVLALETTPCHKGVVSGRRERASADTGSLQLGASGTATVGFGRGDKSRPWTTADGVDTVFATQAPDGDADRFVHRWTVDATRRPSDAPQRYQYDVVWRHVDASQPGRDAVSTASTVRLSLEEGEVAPLDRLELPASAEGCAEGVTVVVRPGAPAQDRNYADRVLAYELWSVVEPPGKPAKVQRVALSGLHGEKVAFRFPPVRVPGPGGAKQLVLQTTGRLNGRLRGEDALELEVETMASQTVVDIGAPVEGLRSRNGRHVFRVGLGQTLRLELPNDGDGGDRGAAPSQALVLRVSAEL